MKKQYRFITCVFLTSLFLLPVIQQQSDVCAEPEKSFINSTINNPLSDDEFYFEVSNVKWRSAPLANGLKFPQSRLLNKNARNLSSTVTDDSTWFSGVVSPRDFVATQIELGHKFTSGSIATDISVGYLEGKTILVPGYLQDYKCTYISYGGTPFSMTQSTSQPFWYKDIPARRMNLSIDVHYHPWAERATSPLKGISIGTGFDFIMDQIVMKGNNVTQMTMDMSAGYPTLTMPLMPLMPGDIKVTYSQAITDLRIGVQYDFSFTPVQTITIGYSAIAFSAGTGENKSPTSAMSEKYRFDVRSQGWRAHLAYTYSFGVHAVRLSASNAKTYQKITSISRKLNTGFLMNTANMFSIMSGNSEQLLFDVIGNSVDPFGPYPASTDYITAISIAYIYKI